MRPICLSLFCFTYPIALGQKPGSQDFRYGSFEFSLFNDSTNQFSEVTSLDSVRKVLGNPKKVLSICSLP